MKAFSSFMLLIGGFAAGPYLVGLVDHFIRQSPDWLPYLMVLLFAGVLYAVGVDVVRLAGIGLIVGVILFGLGEQFYPQRIDFLRVNAPAPF